MVALVNFNPIWFLRGMRVILAAVVFGMAAPSVAVCAPKELRPPPVGNQINTRVMRGGSVEITLKAFEGRGNPLAYEIAGSPRHGSLREFRQADENRQGFASVVYAHDNDEESTEDEFEFRAKALVGGGVSSPIKVRVNIVDVPPQLRITPAVDFSAVAGESDVRRIMLTNEGGGILEGCLEPKAPFRVEGDGSFRLGRGQSTEIDVRFSPQAADVVPPQTITPAPASPLAKVTLRGEAKEPFRASADPMEVHPDGSRTGEIAIANFSSLPMVVEIGLQVPDMAEAPAQVEIPGEGTARVPVNVGADKAGGAMTLPAKVSTRFHEQALALELPPVPPKLELATPELDFRRQNEAELVVRNAGGMEGRFSLELPGNIISTEGAANFTVAAGAERKVLLRREDAEEQHGAEELIADCGKDGKVHVPILFAAKSPSPTPAPAQVPSPTPAPPTVAWRLNRDVKLTRSPEGIASIEWLSSMEGWTNAMLEIVEADGAKEYAPQQDEAPSQAFWSGPLRKIKHAWERLQNLLGSGRLQTTGSEQDDAFGNNETWKRVGIPTSDLQDTDLHWHITAESMQQPVRTQVSEDFQLRPEDHALVAFDRTGTPTGSHSNPDAWTRVVGRKIDNKDLILTVAQQWTPDTEHVRVEQIVGVGGGGKGTQRYAARALRANEAEILPSAAEKMVAQDLKLRRTTIRFKGLPKGEVKWCRLVSRLPNGEEIVTEPFPVEIGQKTPVPWRKILLAAIGIVLLVLWRSMRKP